MTIQEVIASSTFFVDPAPYRYHLVSAYRKPEVHLQVIHNGEEITVITKEGNESMLEILKTNPERWRLLNIRCGNPFYCQGFIAAISQALAAAGIDITITSTFEYDLVFVQEEKLESALHRLKEIGFRYKE
jgi:hypothetical protein